MEEKLKAETGKADCEPAISTFNFQLSTLQQKIAHAKHLIYEWGAGQAVLLCSFGKDSMVLLDLIRQVLPARTGRGRMNCHSYPLPVIYHRHPYFPAKHEFADSVIRSWMLEVYDFPPVACGVKCRGEKQKAESGKQKFQLSKSQLSTFELVTRYQIGNGVIDLPMNTEAPIERRPFVCGLQWLTRPKTLGAQWPWSTVFIGHKSSDVDPYEGPVPLKADRVETAGVNAVFPLRHWTDQDVWDYTELNAVPYDKRRYRDRAELADKWLNPDYVHACTACIDPRETRKTVPCPKLGGALVRNMGPTVMRMETLPDYIDKMNQESRKAGKEGNKDDFLLNPLPGPEGSCVPDSKEEKEEEPENAIHS
jgi:3'-phosphoadenosine 5'-phosphosulfate sulfotransferase (PAPS reductase)/FAD synthetase